ncbi:hypothetical protein WN944_015637 [Citrus x changshan-huyou]|uniref:Uncharacterized protein n=1 Tax=Citrus x changshan-huyou TaxID=2935761 RepID=A0AAP0MCV2_9ROSI
MWEAIDTSKGGGVIPGDQLQELCIRLICQSSGGLALPLASFESQGSRLCWENLCLPVRAETSSLSCGTGLKVPPTVGALPKIPHD